MRLHPRTDRTFLGALLACTLLLAACADPNPSPDAPADASPDAPAPTPPDEVTGRWESVTGSDVLLLRPDGTFRLEHDLGGAPYEGSYRALEDGRIRLDVPSLAPFYVERDGDDLAFYAPGADRVRYERR